MHTLPVVLVATLSIILSACGDVTNNQPLNRLVDVTTFSYQPATRIMDYPGRVQARYQTQLSFQVEGRLIERLVDVGDEVQKGDPIAVLDAKDYVLSNESYLNKKKAAEADLQRAQRDLARAKELRQKKFIGQSELDKAINIERAAYAELKVIKAEYAQRKNQHGYTQVLAPADGVVVSLSSEVGDVVAPGAAIAMLAWQGDWEFVTAVAEKEVNQLSIGQSVSVTLWAYDDKKYAASVREISPISNFNSPSYKVKLSFKEQPNGVKLGMTGHALFAIKEKRMGLLPTSAIVMKDGQKVVMIVDATTKQVHAQEVILGEPLADHVSIVNGLKNGQWVVIAGANKIEDGSTVRVLANE
ncbi:MAG: efflux RND transporter periplasmic adaptor subunit [Cycloclasticus sp.]|jgi:multidrug efflux system membrane fusion protein|uniref:efflux RND transporter periplasmic adaptor subunit n=1 Tax=Cycloclasticus sp. TaxID=2024830 RepID=UPI00257B5305|nr:efflux RND transporter periplasmic adaptor subunit [Cycloclasticus sp.]MBV1899625.1 efflux RND transporter periplasmic adaptor subunit [Cycloclasticus sp.]